MELIDIVVFIVFAVSVVAIGLIKSRGEKDTSEDYFLAGRGLTWPLIGFSLIAANISAEQMVGMSGAAANGEIGLAIASYEWMAAITLVCVGFFFLPLFLKSGIYTIPQYLEHRFDGIARTVMSVLMCIMLVTVNISLVTYLGAKFLDPYVTIPSWDIGFIYPIDSIAILCWVIGITAAVYVAAGGLKACAWADIIQGAALIVGGAVITVLALNALGDPDPAAGMNEPASVAASLGLEETAGVGERLGVLKEEKMHMFLPWTSSVIPWTALMIGLWIPNFYYWGLNQYIMQRSLGAKSLAEGQKGIVFAAALKLVIPFVVCVPGIIAFTLYSGEMADRIDGDPKTNRPVLLEMTRSTGIELPADIRIAIAEASGRADGSATDEALLALTDEFIAEAEPAEDGTMFRFNGDFADREPELATAILGYNLALAPVDMAAVMAYAEGLNDGTDPEDNDPWSPGEKLANANEYAIGESGTSLVSGELVGYDYDDAFPILVSLLAGPGFKGFVIAAVMGAVVSSLASMLNAASTIFTMDIYKRFLNREASDHKQVLVGRICVPIAVALGCVVAPVFANPDFGGAFNAIQSLQTYLSPGILTIFLFGLFVPRAPRIAGVVGLVLSPILAYVFSQIAANAGFADESLGGLLFNNFLNRAALIVIVITAVLGVLTIVKPLPEPVKLPVNEKMEMTSSPIAKVGGIAVVICTVILYVVFA
ncbi:MAG: sodium/solute symporter [Planctomycetota bacterium]